MGLQQVFIGFANLYQRFIQDFSRIATSPIAMLKTTGSSVTSAFRVDNNEVVGGGGGARAESSGSVIKRKVGSITLESWLDCQGGSYKGPRRICQLCVLSGLGFQTPQAHWD